MHIYLKHYIHLIEYLAAVLGPDYEVTLHDISDPEQSVVAIANGHISGRTLGSPLTSKIKNALESGVPDNQDYISNYTAVVAENGKMVRSSAFFIRDEYGAVIGILSITFDDSRYRELSDKILQLRHPDEFVKTHFSYNQEKAAMETVPGAYAENFQDSISLAAEATIAKIVEQTGVPVERLTADEKIKIVAVLEEQGVFMMKNAVALVSKHLGCSKATVYRYLSKV